MADGSAECIPAMGNAWHIATADVIGDEAPEIVYACYDGAICCQSASSGDAPRWKYDTGAFPYDLAVADLDGDKKSEALVASADGRLYCVGKDGLLRWSFAAEASLYQVAVVRREDRVHVLTGGVDRKLYVLGADGRLEKTIPWSKAIRLIRTGDLDGDQQPEIVVAGWSGEVQALRWPSLETLWRTELRERNPKGHQGGFWYPQSLTIEDIDGDGPCEMIFGVGYANQASLLVLSGDGSMRWSKTDGFAPPDAWGYGHTSTVVCDFGGTMKRQIVALNGRYLFVLDRTGRMWASNAAPVSFTNLCRAEGTSNDATVYLSSSPNGDDRIYRVRFGRGWQRSFASLQREGKMRQVTDNLERIRKQIMAYNGSPPTNPRYVHVVAGGQIESDQQLQSFFSLIGAYRRTFAYPNSVFAIELDIRPDEPVAGYPMSPPPYGKGRVPAAQMLEWLKMCEKADVPFVLSVAHGCEPWVPLKLVDQIATECPRTCLGFISSEDDDEGDRLPRFLTDYWQPLMNICKRTEKKAFLVEKHAWWAMVPAMKRFRGLVDGTYRDVLVMSVEDSNSRCPELNLAGRLGLYLTGAVNNMSARAVCDELCWNRLWEWECPLTGHPFLRRQMVQTLLGAKYFEYNLPLRRMDMKDRFTVVGSESVELLAHMLGKGLLIPPTPAQMAAIAPQVIRMREPAADYVHQAINLHGHDTFARDPEENESPFEGLACHRGMVPVRPAYLGGYLFGIDRHYGGFIPASPFGLVAIVPAFLDRERCFWAKGAWETDGRWWLEGTQRRTGLEARSNVLQSFGHAASELPVRLEGKAFMQVQTISTRILRTTLIDPGYLDPADRPIKLHLRPDLRVGKVVDLLSGELLEVRERVFALTVPAGAFRIIEIHGQF